MTTRFGLHVELQCQLVRGEVVQAPGLRSCNPRQLQKHKVSDAMLAILTCFQSTQSNDSLGEFLTVTVYVEMILSLIGLLKGSTHQVPWEKCAWMGGLWDRSVESQVGPKLPPRPP